MTDEPTIDGRRRTELRDHAESIAPYYTEAWDPESDDVGTVMLELFAELAEDLVERLDRVPEKHRIGFFDRLGFSRHPPQSARLPLTFEVTDDIGENVSIPAKTRAVAEATDDRPERTFQLPGESGFEATPATLRRAYGVDPGRDLIFDAQPAVGTRTEIPLFGGKNRQEHVLYVGHSDRLAVNPGGTIQVALETDAESQFLRDSLSWEFYGEAVPGETDDPVETWHPFVGRLLGESTAGTVLLELELPDTGALVETEIDGIESSWIRCRVPRNVTTSEPFDVRIESVGVGPAPERSLPDSMRYNDVPLPADTDDGVLPFGKTPQRLDTFYVASGELFSKKDVRVELVFESDGSDDISSGTEPQLSWEYWDGSNWARIDGLQDGTDKLRKGETAPVSFDVPTDLEPTSVAGEEGHWIRVRLVGGDYGKRKFEEQNGSGIWEQTDGVTAPEFARVWVQYARDDTDGSARDTPEAIKTHNNLAFGENLAGTDPERFAPFEGLADEVQTVYLGFDDVLRNGPINLFFSLADREYPAEFYPRIRWEYCRDPERDEWERLDVADETEHLTQRGIVSLVFPEATTEFELFGRRLHWIRGRVTRDEFAPILEEDVSTGPIVVSEIYPVRELVVITNRTDEWIDLSGYRIDFEYNQPAKQVREFPEGTALPPGESLVLATGTKATQSGDVQFDYDRYVLHNVEADTVAVLDPDGQVIGRQTYRGGIGRKTIRPGSPVAETRGRVGIGGRFERVEPPAALFERRAPPGDRRKERPQPCQETLTTVPPTGEPTRTSPVLEGLYPNTGWAVNVREIDDEVLGSSDGSRSQEFVVSSPPIIEGEVWVDELAALSEGERRDLRADPAVETAAVDAGGDVEAFWVRWQQVADFLESGDEHRHYTRNPASGTITFGDGVRGKIPPRGRDNVKANYRTGGGTAGNVARGTATDLSSSIPFVDDVTNPEPGDGGADEESMDDVLSRAPRELRDRGRAVTEADLERIALSASRKLERTKCVSGMDENGDRTPGWVTILVVPRGQAKRPTPSIEIKRRVRDAMRERAPATLFDPDHLVVRGPSYVEVTVDSVLEAVGVESTTALESRANDALDAFLHPLTGGPENDGWEFGRTPCLSDFYALLEGIDGVDYVDDLSVTLTGSETEVTLTEGQPAPAIAPDTLVFSGAHEISARGGR